LSIVQIYTGIDLFPT